MFSDNVQRLLVGFLLLAHIALAIGYTVALPPLNWPDEPAHLNYAAALMRGEGFDEMSADVWAPQTLSTLVGEHFQSVADPLEDPRIRAIRYQAHQPPFFYVLAALGLDFPFGGDEARILRVRLLNLALSCGTLVLVFAFLRRISGRFDVAVVGAGFLAVLPTRTFIAVSVGNDVAIEFCFALFCLLLVISFANRSTDLLGVSEDVGEAERGKGSLLSLGVVFGFGLLTKGTAVLMLVLQAAWFRLFGCRLLHRSSIRNLVLTAAVGALLASPWLLRNMLLYGPFDPLAMQAGAWGFSEASETAAGIDRPTLGISGEYGLLPFFQTLFLSFWGVFGWMEMVPGRGIQWLYSMLTVTAVVGVLRAAFGDRSMVPTGAQVGPRLSGSTEVRSCQPSLRAVLLWSTFCLLVGVGTVLLYSLADFQPQGRYLLPLSAPIALLFSVGWLRSAPRFGPWVASAALVVLAAANIYGLLYIIPWYLRQGAL